MKILRYFEAKRDIQGIALLGALILGSEAKMVENLIEVKKYGASSEKLPKPTQAAVLQIENYSPEITLRKSGV
jgi:hypothetical protein